MGVRRVVFGMGMLVGWVVADVAAAGPRNVSFDHFRNLPHDRLTRVCGRLEWQGLELRLSTPLEFATSMDRVEWARNPWAFLVSDVELAALIDTLAGDRRLTTDDSAKGALYEFSLSESGEDRAFTCRLDRPTVKVLVAKMRSSFAGNARAAEKLQEYACRNGLMLPPVPIERTERVRIEVGPVVADSVAGGLVGHARVTNVSDRPIENPIYFMVSLQQANVQLLNAAGSTCQIRKLGVPYLQVSPDGALVPGAAMDVELRFYSPHKEPVRYAARVFAGPGDP